MQRSCKLTVILLTEAARDNREISNRSCLPLYLSKTHSYLSKMASGGASPLPSSASPRTSTPSSNLNPNAPSRKVKICVYCGSAKGNDPTHMQAARDLGRLMAENNISLGES